MNDLLKEKEITVKVEDIAKVCHEANRAYCATLGDDSQAAWSECPDWQKESAVNGVKFHLANPAAGASASHESWIAEKREAGWKYGPVKDAEKKEHPCYVPFEALPAEQQLKDYIFRGVVHAMASMSPEHISIE